MKKLSGVLVAILLLVAAAALSTRAEAAAALAVSPCINVTVTTSGSAQEFCVPVSAATPLPVGAGAAGARNFPGCTVGAASAQCLAANTAKSFVQVENTSTSATIACAWGVAAVLNSAGSFQLTPGQTASWGLVTGGVPTGALNCIASAASTPMYLEWN